MADDALLIVLLVTMFLVAVPFLILLVFLARRYAKRGYVWIEMKTPRDTIVKLLKPNKDGKTVTYQGVRYVMVGEAMELYDGGKFIRDPKPRFRYVQGEPFPYKYGTKKIISANPGHFIGYERFDEQKVIPGETLEVFMKQKLFSDAYASKGGLLLIVIIALVFLAILVLGLYAKGG